jgi:hypothetical protein
VDAAGVRCNAEASQSGRPKSARRWSASNSRVQLIAICTSMAAKAPNHDQDRAERRGVAPAVVTRAELKAKFASIESRRRRSAIVMMSVSRF